MAAKDPSSTPHPARGRLLARTGSAVPFAVMALVQLVGAVVHTFTGRGIPWRPAVAVVLAGTAAGQAVVWAGVVLLRRHGGWDTAVMAYLWIGAGFTCLTVLYTTLFYLAPIPLIAPVAATVARSRGRRRPAARHPAAV